MNKCYCCNTYDCPLHQCHFKMCYNNPLNTSYYCYKHKCLKCNNIKFSNNCCLNCFILLLSKNINCYLNWLPIEIIKIILK